MPDPLTERQAKTLHFIAGFMVRHGHAPTFSEIGRHMGGITKVSAFQLVERLIESDWLTKIPDHTRSLCLTNKTKRHMRSKADAVNAALTCAETITQHAVTGVQSSL